MRIQGSIQSFFAPLRGDSHFLTKASRFSGLPESRVHELLTYYQSDQEEPLAAIEFVEREFSGREPYEKYAMVYMLALAKAEHDMSSGQSPKGKPVLL